MQSPTDPRQERGFALLIVLSTVMLLSFFATRLTGQARVEIQLTQNLRAAAQAEAAADAAIHTALFHLFDSPERRWAADGALRTLDVAGSRAVVHIISLSGKVNPNTVSPALFQALLQEIGVDERSAIAISAAVADWRVPTTVPRPFGAKLPQYRAAGRDYGPPGEPFQSLDEIGLVLGMTPPLLQQLRPHLSLFTATEPDPRLADPIVIRALERVGTDESLGDEDDNMRKSLVVSIEATLVGQNENRFTRIAIIRVNLTKEASFAVLDWATASSAL